MKKKEIALVALIAVVVFLVGWIALKQKVGNTIKENEQKKVETADRLQYVVDSITKCYSDSLAWLEKNIDEQQEKIESLSDPSFPKDAFEKLDKFVVQSLSLVRRNEEALIKLKNETSKDEYTPDFFADLLDALIELIKNKQIQIIDLQKEVTVLKNQLLAEKAINQTYQEKIEEFSVEIANLQAINNELLTVRYLIGIQKELEKSDVLIRPFFSKECYLNNSIPDSIFSDLRLNADSMVYTIDLPLRKYKQINFLPELCGATYSVDSNHLKLEIIDPNEFVRMRQFVISIKK